ncbi:MAG: ATP-binding protein [Aeromicrobium sp.]
MSGVPHGSEKPSTWSSSGVSVGRRRLGLGLAVLAPIMMCAVLVPWRDEVGLALPLVLGLTIVVMVAVVGGVAASLVASVVSVVAVNLLLTAPYGTLEVKGRTPLVALVAFVVAAVTVGLAVEIGARDRSAAERSRFEVDVLARFAAGEEAGGLDAVLRQIRALFRLDAVRLSEADGRVLGAVGTALPETETRSVTTEDGLVLEVDGPPTLAADVRLLRALADSAGRAARDERLRDTGRFQTALLAAVSHDLRSPLAAVKAAVSSLRNDSIAWSPDDEEALLATIEEGADRLDDLVANLLDMTRIQAGAVTAHADPVEPGPMIAAALSTVNGRERVDVDVAPGAWVLLADAGLLERVLANVLGNALTYASEVTRVRVVASVEDGCGVIRIIDGGPGVSATQRERMFEPFQRLGDVPRGEGIGLGLAVARGLTTAMGGALTAEDTDGGGLTVVVRLRLAGGEA